MVCWLNVTKECREKILRLNFFDFDEFKGPLKGALRGPKGLLRAKSSSFGDRNIIFIKVRDGDSLEWGLGGDLHFALLLTLPHS